MAALADAHGPRPTCVVVAALGVTACVTRAVLLRGHRAPTQPTSGTGTGAANAATADSPEPGSRGFLLAGLLMSLVVFIPLVHITASATRLGLSPGHGAAVLAVISATSAATRLGAGWLATPTTLRSLYRATHLLVAAAFGVWALTAQAPFPAFPMLLLVAALFGAGYGGWLSLGPAVLTATCTPSRLGQALGTLASVVGIGGVIGPVLAGPLLETAAPALLLGCATAALTAAAVLTHRAHPPGMTLVRKMSVP
jgi:MFS family permease